MQKCKTNLKKTKQYKTNYKQIQYKILKIEKRSKTIKKKYKSNNQVAAVSYWFSKADCTTLFAVLKRDIYYLYTWYRRGYSGGQEIRCYGWCYWEEGVGPRKMQLEIHGFETLLIVQRISPKQGARCKVGVREPPLGRFIRSWDTVVPVANACTILQYQLTSWDWSTATLGQKIWAGGNKGWG